MYITGNHENEHGSNYSNGIRTLNHLAKLRKNITKMTQKDNHLTFQHFLPLKVLMIFNVIPTFCVILEKNINASSVAPSYFRDLTLEKHQMLEK